MRFVKSLLLGLPLLLGGCGGSSYEFAPVSGRVTLNGQPLAGASVEFQPLSARGKGDPGPGSFGKTDQDGRFVLHSQLDQGQRGAVVGTHRVRIYVYADSAGGEDRDADSGGPRARKAKGPHIPDRYNGNSELKVEVPREGKTDLLFELKSP